MIWRIILGGLWKPILAALAAIGLYAKGRADARTAQKLDDMEEYHDTRQKMDAVGRPNDADDARRRMRERKPGGGL